MNANYFLSFYPSVQDSDSKKGATNQPSLHHQSSSWLAEKRGPEKSYLISSSGEEEIPPKVMFGRGKEMLDRKQQYTTLPWYPQHLDWGVFLPLPSEELLRKDAEGWAAGLWSELGVMIISHILTPLFIGSRKSETSQAGSRCNPLKSIWGIMCKMPIWTSRSQITETGKWEK